MSVNRDGTGPDFARLSFDGHGINADDEYKTRLLTFARHHPDDGGGYVLDSDGRRRVGQLLSAAPDLAKAAKAARLFLASLSFSAEKSAIFAVLDDAIRRTEGF